MRIAAVLIIPFLLAVFSSSGQTPRQVRKVERWFRKTGEIHFWFLCSDPQKRRELTRLVSFDHVRGDTVWAFAGKRGMLLFMEKFSGNIHRLPLPAETYRKQEKKGAAPVWNIQNFNTYPTYPQYEQQMQAWAAAFPQICRLVNLGTLPGGRKILALKISDSLDNGKQKPRFLYTSTMHGDETAGYPMMLRLIDELLNGYDQDLRLTRLVQGLEIWINPLANPDGTYRGGNNTVSGATRFNPANVDLNRNFPDPEDGPHPDGEPYQPETRIFMKLADSLEFVMAANFHGGAEVANFPWDTWQRRHADEQWWVTECVRFADSARSQAPAGFFDQNFGYPSLPGVVQGFEWYEVNGGRQDYMNWFHNCREVTIELSDTKILPQAQLEPHWNYYRESLLNFIEAALYGIQGQVRDLCTNLPLKARIRIPGHDKDSSHVYSRRSDGRFFRPIAPATYTVEVSAPGYETRIFPGVNVNAGQATLLQAGLLPLPPVAAFTFSSPDLCSSTVSFRDGSGSASSWKWSFGNGDSAFTAEPVYTFPGPGSYNVSLSVANCTGSGTGASSRMVTIRTALPPQTTGDTSTCGARPHILQAQSALSVAWFSSPSGGTPLDTGAVFQTPPLSTAATYYVQAFQPLVVPPAGPPSNTIGTGGFYTANSYHYLLFDALRPFVLRSVRVFAGSAGNRTIQLRNAQGNVVQSRVVAIPAGNSRITLDFAIPAGSGWQLGTAGGNNLYRNNAGASYPYLAEGVVSITGNSAGDPAFYYYFYDWEIGSRCESPRVPVAAVVENAPAPSVSILGGSGPFCSGDTALLQAQALNVSGPAFTWLKDNQVLGTGPSLSLPLGGTSQTIRCRVLSADTCAVNNPAISAPFSVSPLPLPQAPLIYLAPSGYLRADPAPVFWYADGISLLPAPADSLLPVQSGTYTARRPGSGPCLSLPSNPVGVTALARTENRTPGFRVAGDMLETAPGTDHGFRLTDGPGRLLLEGELRPGHPGRFSLKGLPAGMYRIRFFPSGKSAPLLR